MVGSEKNTFLQWMDSRESKDSIWSNEYYRRSLISYIARMYDQKYNSWQILKHLNIENNNSKELDQLQMIIREFEKQTG